MEYRVSHSVVPSSVTPWIIALQAKGFPGGSVVKNQSAKQEMWIRFLGQEGPLEIFFITIHSDILAWEIPWTEEAGGLWSMRSQKSDKT